MLRGPYLHCAGAAINLRATSVFRAGIAVMASALFSGCVATALTPSSGNPSPALSSNLSLAPNNSVAAVDSETAEGNTDTVQPGSPALAGITVPVRRPGSLAPKSVKLALAESEPSSVAVQKTEEIARKVQDKPNANAAGTQENTKPIATVQEVQAPKKQKPGFFASLFQSKKPARPKRSVPNRSKKAPKVSKNRKIAVFRQTSKGALPGVRKLGLFGIYDAKEGEHEGYDNRVRLASIGGLARTSPNGLRIQHSGVQVACLQPDLVRIIKKVQRRYGRVPIITSGYRSPNANRRARGARNSMHIYCKAADIQVTGVSKWALAKYLRSIPGRGGVGTYCHTKSVHIDVGSKRDWNWRCRRGKKRRGKRKRRG